MQIMYINNDGSGYCDHVETSEGTTVGSFFEQRVQGRPTDYLIRVNRQPVTSDQVLQPGDRISITPTKIQGAGNSTFPQHHYKYFIANLAKGDTAVVGTVR